MRKILLVDDHNLIYNGLKDVITNFSLVYASSVQEAKEKLGSETFYAVILDITIGNHKGFELFSFLQKSCYSYILTMHKTASYIQMAMELGANGYFLKDESAELLIEAINRPISRKFWMSEVVQEEAKRIRTYEGQNYDTLTPREQQIFVMLAEDISYIEIAHRLGLSKKTVNNHRDHIMKKLEITTQIGLVREAVRLGIISIKSN